MGAIVRGFAALMLAMLLLALPSFGQRAGPRGAGLPGAGLRGVPHGTLSQPLPSAFAAPRALGGLGAGMPKGGDDTFPIMGNGRLSRPRDRNGDEDRDRKDDRDRKHRDKDGFFPFPGMYPPYGYGYGNMGYPVGDYGSEVNYQSPVDTTQVIVPPEPPDESGNAYFVVDNNLVVYDAFGNLLSVTPLPDYNWPTGGREAEQALRSTQGYWAARLKGLQAENWTDGKGFATFWLSPSGQEVNFELKLTYVRNVTSAYIRLTDPNLPLVASPAIVCLYDSGAIGGRFTGTLAAGAINSDALIGWLSGHRIASLVQAIDQGHAVVVVHTAQHPQGELMGTVSPVLLETPAA